MTTIHAAVALPTDAEGIATFDRPKQGYTVAIVAAGGEPVKCDPEQARHLARKLAHLADTAEAANLALFPKGAGQLRMAADEQSELVV